GRVCGGTATGERSVRGIYYDRGLVPRYFTLVSFGGAGAVHAAELAAELGLARVYVPRHPGLLSAWGVLAAETIRDFAATLRAVEPSNAAVAGRFRGLERAAIAALRREGLARPVLERALDVRYAGQAYEVQVPYRPGWRAAFHRRHAVLFGHADPRRPLEVVALRLRARGGGVRPPHDPVPLAIANPRLAAVAEEMGVVLCRTALSPNIKERRDFSCAVFDARGGLVAQAAHIPVHLGSTALSVRAAIASVPLGPGDVAILNDPFAGGTHLPDVTVVAPVFLRGGRRPFAYVANRAHHADIGGMAPGSMPLATE